MKTVLSTLSALALLSSAALADCAGHAKVTAAKSVDSATTTASIGSEDATLVAAKKKPVEEQDTSTE